VTIDTAAAPRLGAVEIRPLSVAALDPVSFAPFGQVILPGEDGTPYGPEDAQLDLAAGIPRFYIMRLGKRSLRFTAITRHRKVTQCLASVGGADWLLGVAPPYAIDDPQALPRPEDIVAFHIPGSVAIKLHRGTWHAGPYFTQDSIDFFNLELSDTNLTDHHTCRLDLQYHLAYEFATS
jgi:ureidoglycolate lyase